MIWPNFSARNEVKTSSFLHQRSLAVVRLSLAKVRLIKSRCWKLAWRTFAQIWRTTAMLGERSPKVVERSPQGVFFAIRYPGDRSAGFWRTTGDAFGFSFFLAILGGHWAHDRRMTGSWSFSLILLTSSSRFVRFWKMNMSRFRKYFQKRNLFSDILKLLFCLLIFIIVF